MALQAIDLAAGYGRRIVLDNINVTAAAGVVTVLIGANGSGKSTLLRTLTGGQAPLRGRALLDGRDVASWPVASRARHLSLVITDRTGGGGLRVEELVAIGRNPYSGFMGRLSDTDRKAVDDAIEAVGLGHKRRAFAASLSDGERQKAMIARAMAQETGVMVLDEPTSFLDVAARHEIMHLLSEIAARGTAVLLSTHDIAPAMSVATDVWAITDGTLVAGVRDSIIASGCLDRVYPGMIFDPARLDFKPVAST